jgi:hypothetical protein
MAIDQERLLTARRLASISTGRVTTLNNVIAPCKMIKISSMEFNSDGMLNATNASPKVKKLIKVLAI